MAAKTSWRKYGTKLRHCHLMYILAEHDSGACRTNVTTTGPTVCIIGTVRIVCGEGSTQLSGVRMSVRLSVRPVAAGLLLWARWAGDINRCCTAGGPAVTSSRSRSAAACGGRMRAVPRCWRT